MRPETQPVIRVFIWLAKKIALCYNVSMDEMVNQIDFETIWPGFAPCVLISEGVRSDVAHLVRDMFYTFQIEHGETRFPDEDALSAYPRDLDNYRLKLAENHYLAKTITDNSMIDLQQFVVLREARRRIIGDAMMQEQRAETVYGMAEYAGLLALNQISRTEFMEKVQGHLVRLRNPHCLFDIASASLNAGCMICFALKSLDIDFSHNLNDSRTIYEFIPRESSEIEIIFNERVKNGIYSKN